MKKDKINIQEPGLINNNLYKRTGKKEKKGMYQQVPRDIEDEDEIYELEKLANQNDEKETKVKKTKSLKEEYPNIVLLVVLYLLQGIPGGLAFGSLPFLLKEKLSYSELALFSLVGYPYSLKLLWSPIVDSLYIKSFGRRKTWIIPIQFICAFLLYWLGHHVDSFLSGDHLNVTNLTILFTFIVFLSATQDIAVDGWALTLLSEENLSYASTCQSIGLNTGYFASFTIFLALNSPEFCNKYLRSTPSDVGVVTMSSYLTFWGLMYFFVTVILFFKKEDPEKDEEMGIYKTYQQIVEMCKLPHIQKFIVILLIGKIGYICNDAVTSLKLLEKGFKKEDLALIVLIDFPIQMAVGFYAAKWASGPRPLKPWLYSGYGRLFLSFISMFFVMYYPKDGANFPFIMMVVALGVITSFTSTVQFVAQSAFFNQIADPYIGGTYMTFLNTLSNLGGTWPKYFVLEAVEAFTKAECSVPDASGTVFSCAKESLKEQCTKLGGHCNILTDGYYAVNTASVLIAIAILVIYLVRQVYILEVIPPSKWKIARRSD